MPNFANLNSVKRLTLDYRFKSTVCRLTVYCVLLGALSGCTANMWHAYYNSPLYQNPIMEDPDQRRARKEAEKDTAWRASRAPGIYGRVSRWNGGRDEIDGEVGHPLNVGGPTADSTGGWSASHMILSGSFPPGIDWGSGSDIIGIPTERGHWVVKVELYNIICNGLNYDKSCSFEQELIFHITGSGRVTK